MFVSPLLFTNCNVGENVSKIMVIGGEPVTRPDQSPGVYAIQMYNGNNIIGNASGVITGNQGANTMLTSGHVIASDPNLAIDRVEIKDYQGNIVRSFDPSSPGVKRMINPNYYTQGNSADIGAYVFDKPFDSSKLTHKTAQIAQQGADVNQSVYMVGNGTQDYRTYQDGNPQTASGILRFGSNSVAERDPYGFYMNGVAFNTPGTSGNSVSGPGDSGGGVFRNGANGSRQFVGLMQSGNMFKTDPVTQQNSYFSPTQNPSQISSQPNSAFSYVLDVTKQTDFLDQVSAQGGSVNQRTYGPLLPNQNFIYQSRN